MNKELSDRIKVLLAHYELGVSAFADKIGVQRSSMSHILSGRNKPSLDFIMKVIQTFPEVNLYWLLNGKGDFPSIDSESPPHSTITQHLIPPSGKTLSNMPSQKLSPINTKEVSRIVFFYTDGTFETYIEKKE